MKDTTMLRKTVTRSALALFTTLAVLGFLVASPWLEDSRASAATSAGVNQVLDFGDYCSYLGYTGATLARHDAYGWMCVKSGGTLVPFSVDQACKWKNRNDPEVGRIVERLDELSFSNPYNAWSCWKLNPPPDGGLVGRLNLRNYCVTDQGATDVALRGKDVTTWHCVKNGVDDPVPISMTLACATQYSDGGSVIDRTANFYDPNSVTCWR
jgi:hypothetical protein